jgi:hypothetical protein
MFSTFSSLSSNIRLGSNALIITPCPDPTTTDLVWFKFNPAITDSTANSGTLKNYAGTGTTLTGCLPNAPTLNSTGSNQASGYGSVTLGGTTATPYKYICVPLGINLASPRATGWTISAWVKIPSAANTSGYNISIFALPTSYGQYNNAFPYSVMRQSSTQTYISCLNNTVVYYPTSKFYDDQYHLHTVTIGSGTDATIKFYFDGVQLGTATGTALQNYSSVNGNTFGFLNWGGTGIWTIPNNLAYADLRIYKQTIPADQVRGLFRDTQVNHP